MASNNNGAEHNTYGHNAKGLLGSNRPWHALGVAVIVRDVPRWALGAHNRSYFTKLFKSSISSTLGNTTSSTRRFLVRPSGVSFSATGSREP